MNKEETGFLDDNTHDLIHYFAEIQKIDFDQAKLAARRKIIMDSIGSILDKEVRDGKPDK
jgi:hypothetical protein